MKFVQEEEIYKKNNQSVQITKNSEKQLVLKKQDFRANILANFSIILLLFCVLKFRPIKYKK